jgi:ectoine hydroxylase-related dioxygenase (phytanoyl-CoA dioxygenase family)
LNVVPSTRELANSFVCRELVEPVLGSAARVVRGVYFDKHREANWKVAWHQDLTIAVRERVEVEGYGPWSIKAGIHHVQPPVEVLENMLTLRLHLDDADETNGALRVLPGTHKHGRFDAAQIEYWKKRQRTVTCAVRTGGAVVMRPLLLHSSTTATMPAHRRVLHFEYSGVELPAGLRWFEH